MGSLQTVRYAAEKTTTEQLSDLEESISAQLVQLLRITAYVQAVPGTKVPELDLHAPLSADESLFVENNLISKGHEFEQASLLSPFENVTPQTTTQTIQQQPSLRPPSPSRARSPLSPISNPSRGALAQERISPAPIALKHEADATSTKAVTATPTPPRSPKTSVDGETQPTERERNTPSVPNRTSDPSHRRSDSKPASDAISPDLRMPMTTLPGPKERTSKVLHLPPKEHQEQHIREVERAQAAQRHRERKEDEQGLGISVNTANADLVSSPSSTTGAYSTSTPKPAQHSPDTSPDADYSHEERERLRQASLDQLTKASRDNEMEVTPDAQLRREVEQAGTGNHIEESELSSTRDRSSLDAGFARSQFDAQTPRPLARARRSDNLDIDMNDGPTSITVTPMAPPSTDGMPRRMTRVASGAMRQKSVSEILGEAPKLSSTSGAMSRRESFGALMSDGDRPKHSMVVFSKADQAVSPLRNNSRLEPDGYLALKGAQDDADKDYLRPLFLHQAYQPPRAQTLSDLIQSAHKTLTTTNMYANIREGFDYRILRRIYHLQNANKWAFRQMAKFPDPAPPTSHIDHMMAEMKWMRTDFREERKWKQAGARRLAEACETYVNSTEDVRSTMRIKAHIPPRLDSQDSMEGIEEPPELDHSGSTDDGDSLPDDGIVPFPTLSTIAPATLFNLGYDDVVFELDESPASDGILQELPMYESKPPEPAPFGSSNTSLIPVSKYVTGKLVPKPAQILQKRSRYQYESEEEEPASRPTSSKRRASEVSMFLSPARRSPKRREISPEATDVALFDPINRHIRDRLHANHAFRPPSEFPMPATTFFEWRQNSQWTWDEDQKLRSAVKKFSYNWSLIAMDLQMFSQPSVFVAAQERRTPWECFERWEQLEGLPNDMDKTSYFRTYRSRIQTANRNVEARAQAAQQAATASGNTLSVRRRTETNPFRVQRRKDDRHMMMIGAITKLQRKRETHLHRQQESAKAAMLRKQHNEANQKNTNSIHTPQEFSRMKHEREVKMAERQELYRQTMLQAQQQKNMQMQRQMQGGQPMVNGAGQAQRAMPNGAQGQQSPQAQMTNGQPQQNGSMQQRPTSQGVMQNGFGQQMPNGMTMQMPNGQPMQNVANQRPMNPQSQQDMRMLMAQRQAYAMSQGQSANNLAAAHIGQMQSPQMLAAIAAQRNVNPTNGQAVASMPATSPRGNQAPFPQQSQHLSSGYQPALLMHQQQVAAQFPHFTSEQVSKLANERLKGQMQRMQANAMNAASGVGSPVPPPGMTNNMMMQQNMQALASVQNSNVANGNVNGQQYGTTGPLNGMSPAPGMAGGSQSPTQYAAALSRNMQQAARMGSGSPAMGNVLPVPVPATGSVSRSGTPQMQQQRPGSSMDGSPSLM